MFTENQVRQFYVAEAVVAATADTAVTNASAQGTTKFVVKGDEAYFLYKGPSDDGLQRSDLIKKCNVTDVRLTDAADLVHPLKKYEVTLATLNGSASPIVGQDYVLNVSIHNYVALDYNTTKIKFGVARAASTTASDLYKAIAISLAKNFSREPSKFVKITLKGDSNNTEITGTTKAADLSSITATGIFIEEVEQPWRRGAASQEFVNFEVKPSTVYVQALNDDLVWGVVNDVTPSGNAIVVGTNALPNSKKVADMEWFFHKERGDKYGEMCWPWNIDTVYQVNPSLAAGYSMVDIHYYFEGNSHNVGHSEKTITIVGTKTNLKSLIGSAATTGQNAAAATGLYAFLEGTGVEIKKSASWG